jgi:hypothetical protein
VATVSFAAATSSISVWVNWRAPFRTITRLLSFDIGFSFQLRAVGLLVQNVVWIADRAGSKVAGKSVCPAAYLYEFILSK